MKKWQVAVICVVVISVVLILSLGLGLGLGLKPKTAVPTIPSMNSLNPLSISKEKYVYNSSDFKRPVLENKESIVKYSGISWKVNSSEFTFETNHRKVLFVGNLTTNSRNVIILPFSITGDLDNVCIFAQSHNENNKIISSEFLNPDEIAVYFEKEQKEEQEISLVLLRKDFNFENEARPYSTFLFFNNFWFMTKNRNVGNVETFEYNIGVNINDVVWVGHVKAGSQGFHNIKSIKKKSGSNTVLEISIETLKTSLDKLPLQISIMGVAVSSDNTVLKFKKPWLRTPKKN